MLLLCLLFLLANSRHDSLLFGIWFCFCNNNDFFLKKKQSNYSNSVKYILKYILLPSLQQYLKSAIRNLLY